MPAFTAIGAAVATYYALTGVAATIVGALVATGAAYITSRVINGNPNKGNNSAQGSQGGRIQVPPATNNKIPVIYGNSFVNGIITDARLITTDQKINDTMYYCIVLSETCQSGSPTYTIDDIYWNDLRLTFDATYPYKVKDGRKNVDNPDGVTEDFIDTNFINDSKNLVEVRVYAGGSADANQIFPTTSTTPAYTYWAGNDGSWNSTHEMKGLVYAIVKVTYNGEKGFTGLPNMTFRVNNTLSNPADVWYDYMTGDRYGAGIPAADIDTTAQTAWRNFCDEDITYTDKDGATNQSFARYAINGPIDTSRPVKENIDIIMQNAGAWLSYNVATGLWSPIIKKAVTAGELGLPATFFTASRSTNELTVTNFPAGRIEAGQLLYNSSGTLIGTILSQVTPTAGQTAGQIGKYITSTSGSISSTTFYTLPAQMLAFTDDNIISGISISSTRLDDLYNSVEAEFYDKHNKDQKAYARNEIDSGDRNPNEPDNQLRLSLDLCNNSMQADLLGQLELRQSRDDLVVEFTTNQYGIQAQAGDIVSITSELYDWNPKYFRVMRVKEQETEEGGLVAQIQALEYNPDVYTIEPITEFSTSANIGIGVYAASPNLPQPPVVEITQIDTDVAVPNFQLQVKIPTTGGPYDEIELYFTEGWDPMSITGSIVPGTGSNGAPVGDGLLTVTAIDYGALNVGDYFNVSGTNFIVTEQLTNNPASKTFASGGAQFTNTVTLNNTTGLLIGNNLIGTGLPTLGAHITAIAGSQVTLDTSFSAQAAGTYTVFGGLGTYVVDTSATLSGTTTLYDLPVDSDYKYLKKHTPDGNNPTFTNGETVTIVITEVPANSQTYRRWFVKARMGIKKRFGSFSTPTITDLDGNFRYTPNPVASGNLSDLQDVNITDPTEGNSFYYDATTSKWRNTNIITVDDVNLRVGINKTNPAYALDVVGEITQSGDNLRLNVDDTATDVSVFFNSGRSLKWDHGSQRFELNGSTYIQDNLIVVGSTDLGNNYITDHTRVIGEFKVTNNSVNNLFVDRTTGFVGINNATPNFTLDVGGNAWVSGNLYVSDITTIGEAINIGPASSYNMTLSTTAAVDPVTLVRNSSTNNASLRTLTLRSNTTNASAPVIGFGNFLEFETETTPGTFARSGGINNESTGDNAGVLDDFKMAFSVMSAGTNTERMVLDNLGNLQIDGAFTLNGSNTGSVKIAAPADPTGFISTGSSISSTTLTIGTVTSGTIVIGQEITGTGVTVGTKITANISGSGNGSTWQVSSSQSVSSTTITGYSSYTLPIILPTTAGLVLTSSVSGTLSWAPLTSVLGGDVVGPSGATNNAIALFDGASGKIIKNSPVTIAGGDMAGLTRLFLGGDLVMDDAVGSILFDPPGPPGGPGGQTSTGAGAVTSDNNSNTNFTVDTFNAGQWSGAKYTVLVTRYSEYSGNTEREVAELLVVHDGTSVVITELGQAATTNLVTFGAAFTTISGILFVELFADPVSTGNAEDYFVTFQVLKLQN